MDCKHEPPRIRHVGQGRHLRAGRRSPGTRSRHAPAKAIGGGLCDTLGPLLGGASIVAAALGATPLHASVVGTDLPYQTYRDFGENKGAFRPGAEDIPLYDKAGEPYARLNRAPMIDFGSVDRSGIATLVSPGHVISVKHNGGYQRVIFGNGDDTAYSIVNRNEHARLDFHAPRLDKIVTEAAPLDMTSAGRLPIYKDQSRFPVFYRVGAGHQYLRDRNGKTTDLSRAYAYRTGGTVGSPEFSFWTFLSHSGDLYDPAQGPMASYGVPGDSGSPLFAWDARDGKWVVLGVLSGYTEVTGITTHHTVIPLEDILAVMQRHVAAPVITAPTGGDILWTHDKATGASTLTQGPASWDVRGRLDAAGPAALDNGQDVTFQGGGTIVLAQPVDQGAGALTFDGDYTVKPADAQTWRGGGILVNAGHTVDWQVNGVQADSLHKLGAGTLRIAATGANPGTLNVGDGTVILAQQADAAGNKQAFSAARIVSGRPTLVLTDGRQIDPDNISWGYRGGKLDINGNDLAFHQLNGADDGAILTNSGPLATVNLDFNRPGVTDAATMWHGHFTGNINITNTATENARHNFAIDGGIDSTGTVTQRNGLLYLQGHPVTHAASTVAIANKLKATGDDSVLTQPVSFTQPDWETRHFRMASLELKDAGLHLGRNAVLATDIRADRSSVTLGSSFLYIDLNDGNGVKAKPTAGESKAGADADRSRFTGQVTLANHSMLHIAEHFNGGIDSTDSETHISSTHTVLDRPSRFTGSLVRLRDNARVTSHAGIISDGEVQVENDAALSMLAAAAPDAPWTAYSAASWSLNGRNSRLDTGSRTRLVGDILSGQAAHVSLGGSEPAGREGPRAAYIGDIAAPASDVTMRNLFWQVKSASSAKSLQLDRAQLNLADGSGFKSVSVDSLALDDSLVFMTTDGQSADRITVRQSLTGRNNGLHVRLAPSLAHSPTHSPAHSPAGLASAPVILVTAPKGTRNDVFSLNAPERELAFHRQAPQVAVVETDSATQWVLQGVKTRRNERHIDNGRNFMDVHYRNFLTEVNNLNRRMGDLRDAHGETGGWARMMSGSGSARAGYSNRHTLLQIGADRKFAFNGASVFAGATMTYTDNRYSGDAFSGKTLSTGGGLYASTLFDSGLYIDVIGKYVRNHDRYAMPAMGLSRQEYASHSWYLGAETGWRLAVAEGMYVEPQVELVYGTVPGHRFDWQYNASSVSMRHGQDNPLIGRVGVAAGKSFQGTNWQLTSLVGLSYQYDLRGPGVTVLRDEAGEFSASHGRDGRMLMELGVNARIRDNTRFSLSFERSAFGKYNVDKAVNANIRYAF